jgi:hypothetical protein
MCIFEIVKSSCVCFLLPFQRPLTLLVPARCDGSITTRHICRSSGRERLDGRGDGVLMTDACFMNDRSILEGKGCFGVNIYLLRHQAQLPGLVETSCNGCVVEMTDLYEKCCLQSWQVLGFSSACIALHVHFDPRV